MSTHKDEMHRHLKAARDIAAKAEADGNRDFTEEEFSAVQTHLKDYETAKKAFEKSEGDAAVKARLQELGMELGLEQTPEGEKQAPESFKQPKAKSVGQAFVESAEYKAFMAQFPNGQIGEKARVQSMPVGFKALLTGASDTSGGAFVQTDYTGIYEGLGRRPLMLRDLISVRQTTSDTVEFVRQTARGNAAAPTAEATSAAAPTVTVDGNAQSGVALVNNAGGGYKPEGSMAFEKVTATVKTIAEWVPATKRGLADASQLRGLIDQELRDDLREEEEDQIVNGSGSGENLEGILTVSGTQAQAWDTDIFVTTRKAKRKVRTVGRSIPTAYLMNPEDWERFDLARAGGSAAGDGAFLGAGPFGSQQPTLWGLPVVESEAVAAGTAICADFRKAVVWDREQASVSVTDSHADFFIRNLVAVLAEQREAFGVTRPSAFVEIDLTA